MQTNTIVLPGGSGFLGLSAAEFFKKKGYTITILTRGKSKSENGIEFLHWDGKTKGTWADSLEGAKAVINFTGKSVNCIYTEKNKKEIIDSRVDSVRIISDVIATLAHPPEVLIQAASLAIYGDTTELCDENAPSGEGFSVEVCKLWETGFFKKQLPQTRKVLYRIGFVLGKNGGALEPLMKLVRRYAGGTVGSGNQYISWLHEDDLNRMFEFAIENREVEGIYNATGNNPVTNKEFMATLRKVLKKPWSPPVPAFLVKIGAYVFMQTEPDLALTGRRCIPKHLTEQGFSIQHQELETALKEIITI